MFVVSETYYWFFGYPIQSDSYWFKNRWCSLSQYSSVKPRVRDILLETFGSASRVTFGFFLRIRKVCGRLAMWRHVPHTRALPAWQNQKLKVFGVFLDMVLSWWAFAAATLGVAFGMTIRLLWLLTGLILISFTSNIKELKSREMYLPKPGAKQLWKSPKKHINLGLVRATLWLAPELKWVLVMTFCCSHTISQVLQCYSGRTYPRTSLCLLTLHFAHATDSSLSLKVGLSEGFDVTPP